MDIIPLALAEEIQVRLMDLGIEMEHLDEVSRLGPRHTTLTVDDRRIPAAALYLPRMSATEALQASHAVPSDTPLLVIGHRIHEASAKTFRARGIWFVDEVGNAYLRDRGLLVDVRGRRGDLASSNDEHRRPSATNLFSPRRAQVVFVLLNRPDLTEASLRDIAFHAGVSIGIAKDTLDSLIETGFIEQTSSRRELIRGSELLDLWASTYPGGLGRSNKLFVGSGDVENWFMPEDLECVISGEQAVSRYIRNPESLVLYVRTEGRNLPANLLRENRWHRAPGGNITIRRLFWRGLDGLDERRAPGLLVYADLLAAHESRQTQVAHELRRDFELQL